MERQQRRLWLSAAQAQSQSQAHPSVKDGQSSPSPDQPGQETRSLRRPDDARELGRIGRVQVQADVDQGRAVGLQQGQRELGQAVRAVQRLPRARYEAEVGRHLIAAVAFSYVEKF